MSYPNVYVMFFCIDIEVFVQILAGRISDLILVMISLLVKSQRQSYPRLDLENKSKAKKNRDEPWYLEGFRLFSLDVVYSVISKHLFDVW